MNPEKLKTHLKMIWRGEIMKGLVAVGFLLFFFTVISLGVSHTAHAATDDKLVIQIEGLTPFDTGEITNLLRRSESNVVILLINTPGGEVFSTMDLVKELENSDKSILCIVDGRIMSAGLLILPACDVRLSTDRSIFMGHNPYVQVSGTATAAKLKSLHGSLIALGEAMAVQITSKSYMKKVEYQQKVDDTDWYFTPTESLTNGFIDAIITPLEYQMYITPE